MGEHSPGSSRRGLEPSPDRAIKMVRVVTTMAEVLASRGVFVSRLDIDYSSAFWQLEARNGEAEDARVVAQTSSDFEIARFRFFWSARDRELIISTSTVGVLASVENWERQLALPCESLEESVRLAEQLVSERVG